MDFISKLKKHIENSELKENKSNFENIKNLENSEKTSKMIIPGFDINDMLDGKIMENNLGVYFLKESVFSKDYKHGEFYIGKLSQMDLKDLYKIINTRGYVSNLRIKLEDIVFLDIETTGLSSGTGTIAFLVGVGYFDNEKFILKQFFVRDYDEELAMLDELARIIDKYPAITSFNGKSFDWNLLNTRFLLNRIRLKNSEPIHIDLLHPSRVIWKKRLESCSLSSIEENILSIHREDDIPGMFIPNLYFKYLETKNAVQMKKVIKHNEIDIISMVILLIKILELIQDPVTNSFDWHGILGVGRIYEKNNDKFRAIEIYKHCTLSKNKYIKIEAFKNLANLFRKSKEYQNMEICLERILQISELPSINIMIDLAKCYEHRKKDYKMALEIVDKALNNVLKFKAMRKLYLKDLNHRRDRIIKKMENGKNNKI